MPRVSSDQTVTHRLELGLHERKELTEFVDAYRRDKLLANIPNLIIGTAAGGAAVALLWTSWALASWLGTDLISTVRGWWDRFTNFIWAVPSSIGDFFPDLGLPPGMGGATDDIPFEHFVPPVGPYDPGDLVTGGGVWEGLAFFSNVFGGRLGTGERSGFSLSSIRDRAIATWKLNVLSTLPGLKEQLEKDEVLWSISGCHTNWDEMHASQMNACRTLWQRIDFNRQKIEKIENIRDTLGLSD